MRVLANGLQSPLPGSTGQGTAFCNFLVLDSNPEFHIIFGGSREEKLGNNICFFCFTAKAQAYAKVILI